MSATLRNATTGSIVAASVLRANNPWTRGIGLLGRARVAPEEGLWIERCGAVHTLGMRATIDLYFLDREDRVIRIVPNVPPHRLAIAARGAVSVIELGASSIERAVAVGDQLVLERA